MTRGSESPLTRRQFGRAAMSLGAASILPEWLRAAADQTAGATNVPVGGPNSLRAHAATRGLLYGAAVDPALLDIEGFAAGNSRDRYTLLVATQASIVVAENAMKWAGLRPTADTYDFSQADKLLRFATLARQRVRGHNLCWHEALPDWFKTTANKDNARRLLTSHIQTVAGRYRGQIHSWDVVNEAVNPNDQRPDGLRKTPWLELAGPDYIELAFKTAAEADPQARLTYNEYGIELDTAEQTAKRGQVLLLLRRLKARGVPVNAVGIQSHLQADGPQPGAGLQSFMREAAKLGLEVYVTEMDVNTRNVAGGPDAQDEAVARVYRNYLGMVLSEPNVRAVLTWGITSAHSWLNEMNESWSKRPDGAPQRPLPFDDQLEPTPAFLALRAAMDASYPRVPSLTPLPMPVQGVSPVAVPSG